MLLVSQTITWLFTSPPSPMVANQTLGQGESAEPVVERRKRLCAGIGEGETQIIFLRRPEIGAGQAENAGPLCQLLGDTRRCDAVIRMPHEGEIGTNCPDVPARNRRHRRPQRIGPAGDLPAVLRTPGGQIWRLSMIFATCSITFGPAVSAPRRWPGMQKDFEKL